MLIAVLMGWTAASVLTAVGLGRLLRGGDVEAAALGERRIVA
jgi:hypothetical protein